MMVTPSRSEEPLKFITGSVTLITRREIQKENPTTVAQVLKNVAGINIYRQGSIGEEENISIRGSEFDQVLVLINGIKANSPFSQEFDFGDVTIDNIERIEIVRGAYSSLYGSEAVSGVINIITKKGRGKNKFYLQQEAGNYSFYRELLSANGRYKKTGYSISFSRTNSDLYLPRDSFLNNSLRARFDIKLNKNATLEYSGSYLYSKKDLDLAVSGDSQKGHYFLVHDKNRVLNRNKFRNALIYKHHLSKLWKFNFFGSMDDLRLKLDDPADNQVTYTPLANFKKINELRKTFGTQHDFKISIYNSISIGFEYEEEQVTYKSLTGTGEKGPIFLADSLNRKRFNKAFFVQNNFFFNNYLFLNIGIRIDKNSSYKEFISPKISAAYLIKSTNTKIKGGYGKSFKAPSFIDLYHSQVGNPDLKAEKSQSYDAGFEQSVFNNIIKLEFSLFKTLFKDMVQSVPEYKRENIGKAESQGIETIIKIKPKTNFNIIANFTHLKTRNIDTADELTQKPYNSLQLAFKYTFFNRLNTNLYIRSIGSQFYNIDITNAEGDFLKDRNPGFTVVDVTASYSFLKRIKIFKSFDIIGKVNNLFDKKYMEVKGFPSPPLNFLIGIRTKI